MIIQAHSAEVKTASIQVKALIINGKQVTLAVFRQLQIENLINRNTGRLNGVVWGKVNYFGGDCENDHLHIVWQNGEELRRACVFERPDNSYAGPLRKLNDASYKLHILLAAMKEPPRIDSEFGKTILRWPNGGEVFLNRDGIEINPHKIQDRGYVEGKINEIISEHGIPNDDPQESIDYFSREIDRLNMVISDFNEEWEKSYGEIKKSDQLFIAV